LIPSSHPIPPKGVKIEKTKKSWEALTKFTGQGYKFSKRRRPHWAMEFCSPSLHCPSHHNAKGNCLPFYKKKSILTKQNKIEQNNPHGLKGQNKHEIWQGCWNYQIEFKISMVNTLRALMGNADTMYEQIDNVSRGIKILRLKKKC
jgi:hypothetical protein